jgi:hypothetical protein
MTPDELKFRNYLAGKPGQGNTFEGNPEDVGKKLNLNPQQIEGLREKYREQFFKPQS